MITKLVYIRVVNKTNKEILLDTIILKPMGITDIEKSKVTEYMKRRLDILKKSGDIFYETIYVDLINMQGVPLEEERMKETTKKKGRRKKNENN